MPENRGLYQKFDIVRRDGKPAPAAYFVLDVANDPHAQAALKCYRISCAGTLPDLAADLIELENEIAAGNHSGAMMLKLRTP